MLLLKNNNSISGKQYNITFPIIKEVPDSISSHLLHIYILIFRFSKRFFLNLTYFFVFVHFIFLSQNKKPLLSHGLNKGFKLSHDNFTKN